MIFRAGTAEARKMLDERAYLRPSFSTADEVLARGWFIRGVPLKRIGEVILMRCGHKYLSWSNNQSHAPISSLRYPKTILDEIARQNIPDDYWDYVRFRLKRMEQLWIESFGKKSSAAGPDGRPNPDPAPAPADKEADSGMPPELGQSLTNLPD